MRGIALTYGRYILALTAILISPAAVQAQAQTPQPQYQMPRPVPKPVLDNQQMIACPSYGPGFFRQPGSSVCIKVGGQVRGETGISGKRSDLAPRVGSTVRGNLILETRTPSDYGTIRTVVNTRGFMDNAGLNSAR
jgi:hypothetical protein